MGQVWLVHLFHLEIQRNEHIEGGGRSVYSWDEDWGWGDPLPCRENMEGVLVGGENPRTPFEQGTP